MSWLDGMEGDDPAYPGPAADPWAVPGFMPGISRGILVKRFWESRTDGAAAPRRCPTCCPGGDHEDS